MQPRQLQAKPFFSAATKIRIGRGRSLPPRQLQASHSFVPLRKLESDAEDRCRYEISRRNHSPLHRFASLALKSRIDARKRVKTGKSLHRFASLALKSRIDARKRVKTGKSLHRFSSLALKSRIDARKRVKTGKSLQRFASLGLKSRIDARMRA